MSCPDSKQALPEDRSEVFPLEPNCLAVRTNRPEDKDSDGSGHDIFCGGGIAEGHDMTGWLVVRIVLDSCNTKYTRLS